jgi:hypothetical protein
MRKEGRKKGGKEERGEGRTEWEKEERNGREGGGRNMRK